MKRLEIIFSQSIDEDFIQKCAQKDVGKHYTKIPSVLGCGYSDPKMATKSGLNLIQCTSSIVQKMKKKSFFRY